ncbi:D-2-hydroxyacid dehydrogenase [Salinibacterium sp. G-O1]|uniref:D-2-hydroxyacid dehydrogenase n=1 Tax=Salinibacterium sp. G-O1 TaxID=3046208 RepID=UPI0024B9D39B|nr:D-2-hydroxyacid dehydrogenase [Salinibacterium sp. G-O1]MDJ0333855.1 D-2-hydroxyacid dehydrogenase [Salinibacterium sp. G-O1]
MSAATPERLRVAMATPLGKPQCDRLLQLEPRIDLLWDPSLMPAMRHATDYRGDPDFARTPAQTTAFERLLDSADALFGIPDLSPDALRRAVRANPRLRWVQTMAAGGGAQVRVAGLDAHELERVVFTTSAGVHGGPLSEFALLGLLAGAKNLPRLRSQQAEHAWAGWEMNQLSQQTIVVIGLGGIGSALVRLVKALGCRVIGTSRTGLPVDGVDELVHPDELDSVVARADAVVVTLPGTDATAGLIGEGFFAALKPGATFVNVGRGSVVDETALTAALRSGRVGFAALDVFEREPLETASALWDMPNVLISPHTAAASGNEPDLIIDLFAHNAASLLDGRPLKNVVNTVEFY